MSDEPKDLNEIRQRLFKVAHGHPLEHPQGLSVAGSIVRSASQAADYQGLSGEDRYALMAWHLLQHATRMEKMMLTDVMLTPARMIATPEPPQEEGRKA